MTKIENRKQKAENRKTNLKSVLTLSSRLVDGCAMRFRRIDFLLLTTSRSRGFILPFAMLLAYVILVISMGISDILTKEIFFSYIGRESQIAYYSADAGLDCALYIDDAFVDSSTGIGIFPYNNTDGTWELGVANQSQYNISQPNLIYCAGSEVFITATDGNHSAYTRTPTDGSNPINGVTTNFMLHMDQGNGNFGCALVSIDKKLDGVTNSMTRRVISRGYNTCNTDSSKFVERAIINIQ